MRWEGNDEPQVMTAPSHIHPSKWCTEVPPDKQRFPLCSRSWCESYTKQFSVSWLSSLTETKRLSFFLTPPNSLKCHRNTFSWCRAEQQCQTWRCSFPFGVPLFKTHSLALLLQIRVKFTCTRSWVYRCLTLSLFAGFPGGKIWSATAVSQRATVPQEQCRLNSCFYLWFKQIKISFLTSE